MPFSARSAPLRFALAVAFAVAVSVAHADGLTLSASFEESLNADYAEGIAEPMWARQGTKVVEGGVSGNCAQVPAGGNLTYDAPGNCYWQRGTLAFWWNCQDPIGTVEFEVATIGAFEYFYYGRWFRLYCSGGRMYAYIVPEDFDWKGNMTSCGDFQPRQGQWYHIAMAWDCARGFGIYVDGELRGRRDRPWYLWTHLNQIGLGVSAVPSHAKASALRTARFDEVRVFDRWLSDEQIADLAQRREVTEVAPLDEPGIAAHRVAAQALDDPAGMPTVPLGGEWLTVAQPQVLTARDVLRTCVEGLDGNPASQWPSPYGYSISGRRYDMPLAGEAVNHVAVSATLRGDVLLDERAVLTRAEGGPVETRALLDEPMSADLASITRQVSEEPERRRMDGCLTELRLLQVGQAAGAPAAMTRVALSGGDWQALGADGRLVHDEYTLLDRECLAPGEGGGEVELPAARIIHILGPEVTEQSGVEATGLELALRADAGTKVRIELVHPLNYQRRAVVLDAALEGTEGALRMLVDHRDLLVEPGRRLHLTLQFSAPTTIDAARSALLVREVPVEQALAEYYPDQMRMVKQHFMRLSEARPWGWPPERIKKLAEFYNALDQLYALRPTEPSIRAFYHWVRYQEPKPLPELAPPPAGVPEWAAWQQRLIAIMQEVPRWWIENRQAPNGEFGSNDGLNDDSVLVQDYAGLSMMDGPNRQLIEAAGRVADNCWERTMTDGINNQVTDPLHSYEWGMNVHCMLAVMDYGNPKWIERLMAMARHYEALTGINARGHRHYRSNRYGLGQIVTEGNYGWDTTGNALNLQAGALLAWYNGQPITKRYLTEWVDAWLEDMVDPGDGKGRACTVHFETGERRPERLASYGFPLIVWGAYDLTGEQRYLDGLPLLYESDRRYYDGPTRTMDVAAQILMHSDRPDFRENLAQVISEVDLWTTPIRYTDTRPELMYLKWLMTGEREAVVEGLRASLSDMTWELPMYTIAEQSPDRLWLPQALPNMMMLGDVCLLRNRIYPLNHVSWEDTGGHLAAWVLDKGPDHLRIWLVNTGEEPITPTMRTWRLGHGLYGVTLGADLDEDGAMDAPAGQVTVELARGWATALPELTPGQVALLEVSRMRQLEPISERPDLALSAADVTYDAQAARATVVVHNIGGADAGAFTVAVRAADGAEHEHTVPGLPAPVDLQPRTVSIETFAMTPAQAAQITVTVDGENEIAEITEGNNEVTVAGDG